MIVRCAAVLLAGVSVPMAHAQTTGRADAAAAAEESAQTAEDRASDASGDIVVTAQRREQRLTEVPIAITVIDQAALDIAQVTNVRDLTRVTPGLRISGNGANVSPAIRGVFSDQTDPGNDANVSIYIDGVYQANTTANNFDLADVERVEVLKGPQGTLFGRNATGGAIRIFTFDPDLDRATGNVEARYGNRNRGIAKGFVSIPIVPGRVAASVSGYYEREDGYVTDLRTGLRGKGVESGTVRGKLLVQASETLSVQLLAAYSDRKDRNITAYVPLDGNTEARINPAARGAIIPAGPFGYALSADPLLTAKTWTGSVRATLETGIGDVTSTTAYIDVDAFYNSDADATPTRLTQYPISSKQRDWSQEFIFSSRRFGIAQVTAGAFYYNSDGRYDPLLVDVAAIGTPLYGYMRQKTEAVSGFGELTLEPLAGLTLIGGARYSHETRAGFGQYYFVPGRPATLPAIGDLTFNAWTPRASIRYEMTSGDNLYFTYSKGFKSGGIPLASPGAPAFQPEYLDSFEVGLKSTPRRPVSVGIAAFYYDYANKQVNANVDGLSITTNAASARTYGVEVEMVVRPIAGLTISPGFAWLDAKFDRYRDAVVNVPLNGADCRCGNATAIVDLSGRRTPYAPELTFSLAAAYSTQIAGAGTLDLAGTLYNTGPFAFDNNARVTQDSYTTVSARIAFKPDRLPVELFAWAENLTDTLYKQTALISNAGDAVVFARPRSYGIGARYAF